MVDVRGLLREVTLALSDLAVERQVQLICPEADHPIQLSADPRQISTALECLLRNAIEAAPAGGWASLRLEMPAPDRLDLIVEDSGTGPAPAQVQHMFDPFYSGRQAGRGRGLGLPTAWRLAREHGGEVRFDNLSGGPTRFVLSLPRSADNHAAGMSGLTLVTPERMTG
jgi:signal transduction histidine kinase